MIKRYQGKRTKRVKFCWRWDRWISVWHHHSNYSESRIFSTLYLPGFVFKYWRYLKVVCHQFFYLFQLGFPYKSLNYQKLFLKTFNLLAYVYNMCIIVEFIHFVSLDAPSVILNYWYLCIYAVLVRVIIVTIYVFLAWKSGRVIFFFTICLLHFFSNHVHHSMQFRLVYFERIFLILWIYHFVLLLWCILLVTQCHYFGQLWNFK